MSSDPVGQRVAYLLKTFPRLSETFILNEILGLEALGMRIAIFSLRKPAAEPSHPEVPELASSVTYVPSITWRFWPRALCLLLFSHFVLLLTDTRRYLSTARFYFRVKGTSRFEDFLQAASLARALRRNGITHLHAHFANVPTTVAELVSRLTGISFSFTAHAKDIYLTPSAELARKIERATCVLTCTEHNKRYLAALTPVGSPVHLAYHGVDTARFSNQPRPLSPPMWQPPCILSVGRFCEKKGLEYLIEACHRLVGHGYIFQCQIVGYGELQKKLEGMIVSLGLQEYVFLAGRMTQDQLAAMYRQATMFVLPCLVTDQGDRDGIPNVLMEAMASGVPVISTNVSGISELVEHAQNGLLVEPRNADNLADAMALLLLRSDLRRRLAHHGRDTVLRRFTLQASTQHVHRILSAVSDAANASAIPKQPAVNKRFLAA